MERIRVLWIAETANPEWVSVPLEGWSHSTALRKITEGHVVTQVRNKDAFVRAGLTEGDEFTAIDSEAVAKITYRIAGLLRGGAGKGWTTNMAFAALSYYYFEHLLWKRFGAAIRAGEYDVVHRITPLSPTAPSIIARRCARAGVPFVWGPINGGVPWPKGFDQARRQEREWLSYIRDVYKLMPGYRATRRHARAIIAGSMDTLAQVAPAYREKLVYIPENAIDPERFTTTAQHEEVGPLKIAFVGRLVPYKGADMLLEAAAPLVRDGKVTVDIIGDGPEMERLKALVTELGLSAGVRLDGWVEHHLLQDRLSQAQVFAFPSIREFGGAVVLEAMAVGLVPVIVDYAGPAELVTESTGFKVPIGPRERIIEGFRATLDRLAENPGDVPAMGNRARERVFRHFTWDAKARMTLEVYRWALGHRADKPDFGMPLPDSSEALEHTTGTTP